MASCARELDRQEDAGIRAALTCAVMVRMQDMRQTFQQDKQVSSEVIACGSMHMGIRPRHCSSSCWAVWLNVL